MKKVGCKIIACNKSSVKDLKILVWQHSGWSVGESVGSYVVGSSSGPAEKEKDGNLIKVSEC